MLMIKQTAQQTCISFYQVINNYIVYVALFVKESNYRTNLLNSAVTAHRLPYVTMPNIYVQNKCLRLTLEFE